MADAIGNWYDYPQYFDIAFRDETPAELQFFAAAFRRYAKGEVKRVYEPGCGSGRLVVGLAQLGYEVVGSDLSEKSLQYLRRKLRRRNLTAQTELADMTDYVPTPAVDAAVCTFNTFRHLLTEETAVCHLRTIAAALRPGGIYILGFHIIPLDADEDCTERWRAKHGGTSVSVTLRVTDFDRKNRLEQIRVSLLARSNEKTTRCRTDYAMRLYTLEEVEGLLHQVPELELLGVHDFDYQIDEQRQWDDDLVDAVLVLAKR
jgi:SAM-dependent methyltransferase